MLANAELSRPFQEIAHYRKEKMASASSDKRLKFAKPGNKVVTAKEYRDKAISWQDLERTCEEYLDLFSDIRVLRIPNAALAAIYSPCKKCGHSISARLKGLISKWILGQPDFVILQEVKITDDLTNKKFLCVELKHGKSKMRQGQKKFAEVITVHECRSFEAFKAVFDEWYDWYKGG